jgi:hypothetical protein
LQDQLQKQTDLVETIKADISQRDWIKREWQTLRRTKLESLLEKYHDCRQYLERHRVKSIDAEFVTERDPISELDSLATLYFPELNKEVSDFAIPSRNLILAGSILVRDLLQANNDMTIREIAYDKYTKQLDVEYPKITDAGTKLTAAAHSLVLKIMNMKTDAA